MHLYVVKNFDATLLCKSYCKITATANKTLHWPLGGTKERCESVLENTRLA